MVKEQDVVPIFYTDCFAGALHPIIRRIFLQTNCLAGALMAFFTIFRES